MAWKGGLAVGALLVGAALGVAWWAARGPGGRGPLGAAAAGAEEAGARHEATLGAAAAPHEAAARGAVAPAREDPSASPAGERRAEATDLALAGTVVVTDAFGAEHPFESGSMDLVLWRGADVERRRVGIAAGRWEAAIPSNAALGFSDLELGGTRAVPEPAGPINPPASGLLELRARWQQKALLRVRSRATGSDLSGVELLWSPSPWSLEHPGAYAEEEVLASNLSSPIDLGAELPAQHNHGTRRLYVRAPGHAWGAIDLDLDAAGERLLDLVPGGALEILLRGDVPQQAWVRVRRAGSDGASTAEFSGGEARTLVIASLAPALYDVAVEIDRKSLVLGTGSAEVLAGEVAQVSIDLETLPEVAMAPLRGVLVLDPAWVSLAPELRVRAIGGPVESRRSGRSVELIPVQDAVNTWTFDAGAVPEGRYELEIDPPLFVASRQVQAWTGDLRIDVPPPAIALVRVVDAAGGEAPALARLCWYPERPLDVAGGAVASVARDAATGRFEIRAPAGRVVVDTVDLLFRGSQEYDLAPGRQEVDLLVNRMAGFTVTVHDGATPLPWEASWTAAAAQVRGPGTRVGWSSDRSGLRVTVARPGLYRFSLPRIAGFEPIPEQEVLVPERGFAEHRVALVRAP